MDFLFEDKKTQATELASAAYKILQEAGVPESFLPLLQSVACANRGTFFGSFGSDSGCFIEFEQSPESTNPVKMSFGIRRYRQKWIKRVKEAWNAWTGKDSEYCIYLSSEDIMKLKDLLRILS